MSFAQCLSRFPSDSTRSNFFTFLTVAGVTSLLAIQVFLNVAVVTNLVPCTGISLPMFSYGGTALLIQLFELGIVLSASRDISVH